MGEEEGELVCLEEQGEDEKNPKEGWRKRTER